jgi:hypothetical protein
MYLTKQQILSTVQGLPETIELNEFIILFSTMDLKTATTSSQPDVTQSSLLEAAKKYAGGRPSRFIVFGTTIFLFLVNPLFQETTYTYPIKN